MCVCDKIDWMENGWMDWIEWMWKVESGGWRGSGSHTCTDVNIKFHKFWCSLPPDPILRRDYSASQVLQLSPSFKLWYVPNAVTRRSVCVMIAVPTVVRPSPVETPYR